jgi:phenylacetate-CoA ligase
VPASAFRHVLGTDPHVTEYQVIQTAAGADILTVGDSDVDALTAAVIAALRRHGLAHPQVRITVVTQLARHDMSGKLRRFIPLQ